MAAEGKSVQISRETRLLLSIQIKLGLFTSHQILFGSLKFEFLRFSVSFFCFLSNGIDMWVEIRLQGIPDAQDSCCFPLAKSERTDGRTKVK